MTRIAAPGRTAPCRSLDPSFIPSASGSTSGRIMSWSLYLSLRHRFRRSISPPPVHPLSPRVCCTISSPWPHGCAVLLVSITDWFLAWFQLCVCVVHLAGVRQLFATGSLGFLTLGRNLSILVCVRLIHALPCYKRTSVVVDICPKSSGLLRHSRQPSSL